MPRHLLTFVCAAFAFSLAFAAPAAAEYPDRPIRLLVPYPPGGPNDTVARILSEKMSASMGQQVIVENRAGGAGNVAMELTARAAPDGYTAVVPSVSYVTNPTLFSKIGYQVDELAAVSLVTKGPIVLVASPQLGVKTMAELIALAKTKPGKIGYGSGGVGSTSHLSGEMLKQYAGIDIVHIPYRGTNDLVADLLSGRVPLYFMSPLVARQFINDGKVVALGMTSPQRLAGWEDVPTIVETIPGFVVETWHPVVVPKATPKAIVDKLYEHIAMAVKSPEVSAKLLGLGSEPVASAPADAEAFIAAEAKRWTDVIRKANVKVE